MGTYNIDSTPLSQVNLTTPSVAIQVVTLKKQKMHIYSASLHPLSVAKGYLHTHTNTLSSH